MGMTVWDTYPQILEYRAAGPSFSLARWKRYADGISPTLYAKCAEDASAYDLAREVAPVIEDALGRRFDRVTAAHDAMAEIAAFLPGRIASAFGATGDMVILFYLGLCGGAGWATDLDGRPAILLGAEKIAELGWHERPLLTDLVCHEMCHLLHFAWRGDRPRPAQPVRQLYEEGFATRYSQALYREGFYHQDQNGWLAFCRDNEPALRAEYRARIARGTGCADFFGDWRSVWGRSDIGYYLGSQFIRFLELSYRPEAIARLSAEEITGACIAYLEGERA